MEKVDEKTEQGFDEDDMIKMLREAQNDSKDNFLLIPLLLLLGNRNLETEVSELKGKMSILEKLL